MNSWIQSILNRVRAHLDVEDLSTCARDRLAGAIRHVGGETLSAREVRACLDAALGRNTTELERAGWDRATAWETLKAWLRADPALGYAEACDRAQRELGYEGSLTTFQTYHWNEVRKAVRAEGVVLPRRGRSWTSKGVAKRDEPRPRTPPPAPAGIRPSTPHRGPEVARGAPTDARRAILKQAEQLRRAADELERLAAAMEGMAA